MAAAQRWTCRVCWKQNWPDAVRCASCQSDRDLPEERLEAQRKVVAARAERPEPVPDLLVALPVVIFRTYARVWMRGGMGLFLVVPVLLFGGVTDVVWLAFVAGFSAGLVVAGYLAGEVVDGMRDREAWAFAVGIVLAVVGAVGSATAFNVLAPDLVNPNAARWASALLFGGAGLAALAGLVLLFTRRERAG